MKLFLLIFKASARQVVLAAINLAIGIFVVQSLSKTDYASYALVLAAVSLISVLSDGGITNATYILAGERAAKNESANYIIQIAYKVQYSIGIWVALTVAGGLIWLLKNEPLINIASSTILCLLIATPTAKCGIGVILPRLRKRIADVQRIEIFWALARGLLCAIAIVLCESWQAVATAVAITMWLQLRSLNRLQAGDCLGLTESKSNGDEVRTYNFWLLRIWPIALFTALSGQISILLASTFSNKEQIADVGALLRLGQAFGVLGPIFGSLVVPELAKGVNKRRQLSLFLWSVAVLGALTFCGVWLSYLYPAQLLGILGSSYLGLETEVVVASLVCGVNTMNSIIYYMSSTCKVVISPLYLIGVTVVAQVLCIHMIDLSSALGALLVGLIASTAALLLSLSVSVFQLAK